MPFKKMEIRWEKKERARYYHLTLDDADVDNLFNTQGGAVISPYADDGVRFWLYPFPGVFRKRFLPHPEEGYYIYVGSQGCRARDDLVKLIEERGQNIPIEEESHFEGENPINLGFVSLHVRE